MEYYHLHWDKLSVGSVVKKGSMGSFLNRYYLNPELNNEQVLWRLFQEQTFELIRLKYFSDKPSRYDSIFLFLELNQCLEFLERDKREGENIYKIKILDENSQVHKASMKLYERIPMSRPVLPALIDQAEQYWKGINIIDNIFEPEYIVDSDVEIIEIIDYTIKNILN